MPHYDRAPHSARDQAHTGISATQTTQLGTSVETPILPGIASKTGTHSLSWDPFRKWSRGQELSVSADFDNPCRNAAFWPINHGFENFSSKARRDRSLYSPVIIIQNGCVRFTARNTLVAVRSMPRRFLMHRSPRLFCARNRLVLRHNNQRAANSGRAYEQKR